MARRTKEDAEKTRIQILETALELFYEKGYSRCTLVDIAKRIGLTKGAIYWHFKSKVDLFLGLGTHMEEKLEASLADLSSEATGIEAIMTLPDSIIRMITEDRQLHQYYNLVYYRMEWQAELLPVKDFFDQQDQEFRLYAESLFAEASRKGDVNQDYPVGKMAASWLVLVEGFMARALLDKTSIDELLADLDFGLKVYLSGLKV